jgi:predicted HTH transcriptional regulator
LKGTEGLAEQQKEICEFIKEKGKVAREEILAKFNLKATELQKHLAILRHCPKIKALL